MTAASARLAGSFVDAQLQAEISGVAFGIDEIAQRGAANANGILKHVLDGAGELFELGRRYTVGGPTWRDSGQEQGFVGVDIADADHDFRIHDEMLDRATM